MSEELRQDDIDALLNQQQEEGSQAEEKPQEEAAEAESQAADQETENLGDAEADLLAQWEEALKEAKEAEAAQKAEAEEKPEEPAPQAEAPKFEEFTAKGSSGEGHPSLDFILDIPLEISVEIGRSKMIINDLLKLSQGSIIELNKLAGEPAEIYVNQRLMARGEVVVVNDRFAVRLTEIISPQERIRQLGS
ncbi:MAG: flagellar motor switch protein FliN [Thermodesulfobacteria bacterium]|nr:flagellar motor switch protein FliN [Thermodesulfobacteriota bacterium]